MTKLLLYHLKRFLESCEAEYKRTEEINIRFNDAYNELVIMRKKETGYRKGYTTKIDVKDGLLTMTSNEAKEC